MTATDEDDPATRHADLVAQVRHHQDRYYAQDDPEIGDEEYDALFRQLEALEEEHPDLVTDESPTRRVGGTAVSSLEKVRHAERMLSLANARSAEELRDWVGRMRNHLAREGIEDPAFRFVCEPKVDGLAISLRYEQGDLVYGATRGDGEVGEDVTHNLREIDGVPTRIEGAPPVLEVRGEIYMARSGFLALNEHRAQRAQDEGARPENRPFMNPRNAAAGSLRQIHSKAKNPEKRAAEEDERLRRVRSLSLWAYGLGVVDGAASEGPGAPGSPADVAGATVEDGRPWATSHRAGLAWLADRGFPVNPDIRVVDGEDEVVAICEGWHDRRDALDFEIDGVVVKVDDRELQRRLGTVGKDPRWAIAWKFPPQTAVTLLRDVVWSVGKFGDLHPYASLEPVGVSGVTVSQATLHNEEDLARKDVRPGDRVIVLRAGDVIPQVVSPAPHEAEREDRADPPVPPAECPECGTPTVKAEDRIWTACPNRGGCPGQQRQLLEHYVSRGAMDVDGVGEKLVRTLMREKGVTTAADLYDLTSEGLQELDGFGEVSAGRVVASIEGSKDRPFARVLFGVGIEEVGQITGRALAQRFRTADRLRAASADELAETSGIGPKMAAVIHERLQDPAVGTLFDRLGAAGVQLEEEGAAPGEGPLDGLTAVLTGSLPTLTREDATQRLTAAGARVTTSVSKKTSVVVAGESAGSKLEKAERLKVPVLDEEGLLRLLDEGPSVIAPPEAEEDPGAAPPEDGDAAPGEDAGTASTDG